MRFRHCAWRSSAPELRPPRPVSACYLQGRMRWGARLDQRLIGELSLLFPVIFR